MLHNDQNFWKVLVHGDLISNLLNTSYLQTVNFTPPLDE